MSDLWKVVTAVMVGMGVLALGMWAARTGHRISPDASTVASLADVSALSTAGPVRIVPSPFDMAWDDRELFSEGLISLEQGVLDELPGSSIYHIYFEISEDLSLLTGHEEVRYTNREDGPLNEIYFRLFPNTAGGEARVSSVRVNDRAVEPVYEFQESAVRLPLPEALPPHEHAVIEMDFEVKIALEMAGNYGLFGYFDGVLVLDEFYPVIPVYDDEGWNVESLPPHGDVTYFDASFYLVRVSAPAALAIVASGVEVGCEYNDGSQIVTFAAGPARDFYLAASENYTVISETVGETRVNSFAFPERRERAKVALRFASDALRIYNRRFGAYPYTELDIVSSPMLASGVEYPGMVAISLKLYDPGALVRGLPSVVMLEGTVPHEVAHQWFYNAVGNDQVDEPWLDEALAQYSTGLYYDDVYGGRAARDYRKGAWEDNWGRIEKAEIPIGLASADYADNEYTPIIYGRGPLFLEALAKEMGQDAFDLFLCDYFESHKWAIATTDTFKQLAEKHCQCDLTTLFQQWVYENRSG